MHFKRILLSPLCFLTLAHAIIGGREADTLQGQVQIWQSAPGPAQTYVCTGTLISPEWVLTAKHCIKNPISEYSIRANNLNLGEGDSHKASSFVAHPTEDLAAIKLESQAADPVIRYALSELPSCTLVNIRGWGPTVNQDGPDPTRLMLATMYYIGIAGSTNDLGLGNAGQGFPAPGDSGAGVENNGVIYGTLKDGNNVNAAFAVPFSGIGNWIQDNTGVAAVQLNARQFNFRRDTPEQCGGICPGFNFGIADLGSDKGTGKEGYAVLDAGCKQVAGAVTSNPCDNPLFSCSPAPIKIVGLHLNVLNYACREDARAGSCDGMPIQFYCRNDGK